MSPKQKAKTESSLANLDTGLVDAVKDAIKARQDRVFFNWDDEKRDPRASPDDPEVAIVEITACETIETAEGPNVLYSAQYLNGNIHGQPGGPVERGTSFNFWSATVLQNELDRQGVRVGDIALIICPGRREGKRYKDFIVSRRNDLMPKKALEPEIVE